MGAHSLLVGGSEDHDLRASLMSALRSLIYTIAASGISDHAQSPEFAESRATMIGGSRRLATVTVRSFRRRTGAHSGWKP